MNGLQSKPSSSPPIQFQAQQYQRTHTPHTRGPTPPQYYIGAQEADPQGTQFTGISYQTPFQYSSVSSQLVPPFGYANPHDLNKQGYAAPRMPVGGNTTQAAMYQNSGGVRQPYFNQSSMSRASGYLNQPQPTQGLYAQQQIMFMPPPQYGSTGQVIMPMTTTSYPQRMSSPAFQNSMPTAQQGLFQLPQENTGIFTPHAHTHTYNNPPAVFYNTAQQQNRPPSASGMSGPGQQPAKKRESKALAIIDPNSGKNIMPELQQARGTPPSSATLGPHSTVSGQEVRLKNLS